MSRSTPGGRRRRARVLFFALSCALVLGLGGSPSNASGPARSAAPQGAGFSQGAPDTGVDSAARKKKKKKKKKRRGKRSYAQRCWPGVPSVSTARAVGAVQFRWGATPCATRHRVRVSPAWWGSWPGPARFTPWTVSSARGTTYRLPATPRQGDGMIATAYGNPVFGQLEANNGLNTRAIATRRAPRWVAVWPWTPNATAGDQVRFGSYNVMLFPTGSRALAIARNISSHGVQMVALQEADAATASAVAGYLGGTWSAVANQHGSGQQILYRNDLFSLQSNGSFGVYNPRSPSSPAVTPWARFNHRSGDSLSFYVVSVHYSENSSRSALGKNADTGRSARDTMARIDQINSTDLPVLVAGDLRYGREPWGDPIGYTPAQPTFVRAGYWDALASQAKHGHNYSTFSGRKSQKPHPSGYGPRSDHILMKGIRGTKLYYNTYNWSYGGSVPSDHNLLFTDLVVPQR